LEDALHKPSSGIYGEIGRERYQKVDELIDELDEWVSAVDSPAGYAAEQEPAGVLELRSWVAELERGKAWLESQTVSWQQEAEARAEQIQDLRNWISQLEAGKAWLQMQASRWQEEAEERLTHINGLLAWISQLEAGKSWLEGQLRDQQRPTTQPGPNLSEPSGARIDAVRAKLRSISKVLRRTLKGSLK
jgi:chromosome segregation ATPase